MREHRHTKYLRRSGHERTGPPKETCTLLESHYSVPHGGEREKIPFRPYSRKVKDTQYFRNFSISNDLFTKTFIAQMGRCKIQWGAFTPIEAMPLSATSAELLLGLGLGLGLGSHSSSHTPSHAPLLLATLLSLNIPLPHVHWCVMGRLVNTSLGLLYLIAHVLHCPPPPPHTAL
jgi:hypothetical protein